MVLRTCGTDRRCGQRAQDGLDITRRETSGGMTDEWTIFAVKNRGQRRIHRQIIEDRSERPLKLRFAGRFTVIYLCCGRNARIVATQYPQFNENEGNMLILAD